MVKAELKNYRQSPRKVRLVADLIRGKKAEDALTLLTFTIKRSSDPIKKLLESAIANANHNFDIPVNDLFVKEIRVDEGPTLKRWRARAYGRASSIRKRTSRILINLDKLAEKQDNKGDKGEKGEKEVKSKADESASKAASKSDSEKASKIKASTKETSTKPAKKNTKTTTKTKTTAAKTKDNKK